MNAPRPIEFDEAERKYLGALCALISSQSPTPEIQAVWAWEYKKSSVPQQSYTEAEITLLSKAADSAIKQTTLVLKKTTDLEARVKAQALVAAFKSIRSKLDGKQ